MKPYLKAGGIVFLVLLAVSAWRLLSVGSDEVVRIEIIAGAEMKEMPGQWFHSRMDIEYRQDRYWVCPYIKEKECLHPAPEQAVAELARLARQAPAESLEQSDFFLSNSRFKEYAHRRPNNIFQRYGNYYGALPALQPLLKQMFRKNYDNREKIKEALIQFYRHPWIKPRDPFRNSKVKMVVHFGDGEKVVLESDRLRLFKIPWTVHRQGEARFSYDPRITFAFLDLIDLSAQKFSEPEKDELVAFELHGLLKQVDYFDVLGAVVKQSVYSDRDAENLRAHYPEIEQAMVKNYRLLWADKDISGMKARWQRNVGPVPVFLHLKRSPYKGDKFLLQKFESRIGPAVDRLIQIPWLQEALKREPGSTAFIQIDERHTYKFPRPRLNQALRLLQVKAMAPHLTNELSDTLMISLVHQTDEFRTPLKYSDWLVLPDGRMLLYRTNMERLYQWDLSAYRTQFYLGYELPPFLALVSPEGKMSILRQQPKTMEARQ